jgi:signal transduction histidine kinase
MTGLIVMVLLGFSDIGNAAEKRGTAVEAEKLVNRAVEMLKTKGKDAAYGEISRAGSSFVDRDLYLFVIDTEGNTLAHGFNKKLIGKNMLELRDPDGKFFIKEFITVAASKGKGWVDYKFTDPITKRIERKSTYVAGYENLVIGCGIYKQ